MGLSWRWSGCAAESLLFSSTSLMPAVVSVSVSVSVSASPLQRTCGSEGSADIMVSKRSTGVSFVWVRGSASTKETCWSGRVGVMMVE